MKKLLCIFCIAVMLTSVFSVLALAIGGQGMSFDDNSKYRVTKTFEEAPISLEAWVCLPKDAGRAGVVFGNHGGTIPSVNFEITTGGKPRLYVVEYTSGEKVIHDVTFSGVDVRTGEMEFLAIVYDPTAETTYCYVNGVLKASKEGALNITNEVCGRAFALGGDLRSGNVQYFKGEIDTVALYSDVRTAEEIRESMQKADLTDENLIAYYDTSAMENYIIKDMSQNGNDVLSKVAWLSEKEPVTDYAYSFCVVGDTQKIAINEPEKLAYIYDWIVESKDEKKIEFVFGMGDITDKNTDAEWTAAKEQIFKLNGVVPYSLLRGNHDGSAKLNQYFATSEYTSTLDGFYENGKIDNAFREFRVGETDFLVLMLDYGASDAVLNWAAGIIEAHPEHKVIITTHCYLYNDGTTLDAGDTYPPNTTGANDGVKNNGDQMWDKLVSKHENIFLVLSGHDPCEDVVATQTMGENGNIVTQFLVDPQGVDAALGATGMVAMLYFSEDGKTLTVEQYSTVKDMYYMSSSQFTLPLDGKDEPSVAPETEAETEPTRPVESTPAETDPALPHDSEPEASESVSPDETEPKETEPKETESLSASIGIIGGADGPTAIFVAGQFLPLIAGAAAVAAAIGVTAAILIRKKAKNKNKKG